MTARDHRPAHGGYPGCVGIIARDYPPVPPPRVTPLDWRRDLAEQILAEVHAWQLRNREVGAIALHPDEVPGGALYLWGYPVETDPTVERGTFLLRRPRP